MMIWSLLVSNFLNQCSANISYLNSNHWIGICMLVVLTSFMIGAVAYGLSGIFPANFREKIRGAVKYEYVQGVVSLVLITAIFSASLTACTTEGYVTTAATKLGSSTQGVAPACGTSYQDPFQFANCYVGNLLFSKGTILVSDMIAAGIGLFTEGNIVYFIFNAGAAGLLKTVSKTGRLLVSAGSFTPGVLTGTVAWLPAISTAGSEGPAEIFYDYSFILTFIYETTIVVTFGLLFLLFLSLSFIEMLSLTLVLPVAIAMRALSFAGPRLREASNAFIAIAIAFYFVLPMTIAMNYYIVNWTYCAGGGACNPYASSYLGPYAINSLPLINLFTNPEFTTVGSSANSGFLLPLNFYASIFDTNGGFANTAKNVATSIVNLPGVLNIYTVETAQYLFQGIFLIALDVAITVGFAVGFYKGLQTVGQIIAVGPFWGSG